MFDLTEDLFYWFYKSDKLHYVIQIYITFLSVLP